MYNDYNDNAKTVDFSVLKGKTIELIEDLKPGSERAKITCKDGTHFQMSYYDDCCASCSIEEVVGDVVDIMGSEILLAEEVSSNKPDAKTIEDRKAEYVKEKADGIYDSFEDFCRSRYESETWTFYKLSTIKGSLTIRWYGSSNGYYSESATFEQIGAQ